MLAWYERDRPSASSLEHHHLLRAYAKCQLGDRAAAHIARMREDGCAPDEGHCNLAVLACAQYGSAESAAELLCESREAGLQLSPASYNATLTLTLTLTLSLTLTLALTLALTLVLALTLTRPATTRPSQPVRSATSPRGGG